MDTICVRLESEIITNYARRYYSSYLSSHLERLYESEARPIAGDVYPQATNIEDERNGLIGFHSGVLEVPAGLLHSEPGEPG